MRRSESMLLHHLEGFARRAKRNSMPPTLWFLKDAILLERGAACH
jgi:hypothetical protein